VTRSSVDPPAAIFLDTETTGSGPRDAVIELGIVTAGGEALVDSLVAPLAPVTTGARRVHGISEEDLEGAPSFSDVADRLETAFSKADSIWTFSAGYDKRMLLQTAMLADRPHLSQRLRDGPWRDLQPQATDVLEDKEQVSLTDAARRLGVTIPTEGRHHRALYDARLARRIWSSIHRPG
jgi:DNA polymerase-3 subunit epsilon